MKWRREDYLDLMTFRGTDRPMFVELFGPLIGLAEEWRDQGATQEEIDLIAFDWDYVPVVRCGGNTGLTGGSKPQVIEETAEHIIQRDHLGRTVKLCKGFATIPLPLDFPVKTMDDWLKLKPRYAWHENRINWAAVEAARKAQANGALVVAGIPGAWDTPRELMGEEVACLCYYEQPELMHDIMETLAETAMRVLDTVSEKLTIDQLSVHEDMAGRSGSLVGPKQILEYFQPYFHPIWDMLRSRGTRIFDMDSDGNMNSVLESFLDCGLTSMHPMEPAAGMDVVEVRKKFGRKLVMRGGIDKHVLRGTKEDIRRELEYKMQPLLREGGMAFGVDHRIPNGTPIENYRYYVRLGREILGLPPLDSSRTGWARMAF